MPGIPPRARDPGSPGDRGASQCRGRYWGAPHLLLPTTPQEGPIRTTASILHLDLDAFFTSVEQRDKPSLRGRPVIVGGVGGRGVVATASYEARRYGARSAMPTAEARRRCPAGTAFLAGRFEAYRRSSAVVMGLLQELSPLVEQVSIDEAYVDLAAHADADLGVPALGRLGAELLDRIREATGGLTASAGIASSKMLAKIGSDLRKPAGLTVIAPGDELALLHPLPVTRLGGVGPATEQRLRVLGVRTVGDLARIDRADLVSVFGRAHGEGLYRLARAEDDRAVEPEREAKSVSAEETFETDVTDKRVLGAEVDSLADRVGARLAKGGAFGRTVTLKARRHDFSTLTRSETLTHSTNEPAAIAAVARRLLGALDTSEGLRLLGVGVSGLADHTQDELLTVDADLFTAARRRAQVEVEVPDAMGEPSATVETGGHDPAPPVDRQRSLHDDHHPEAAGAADAAGEPGQDRRRRLPVWRPGQDVVHEQLGPGWVWGSGLGRVTVRFEGPRTGPGPIKTLPADDPELSPGDPPDWTGA
ncbi:MAG TPA: DNA polymerase IV [Segeticoccus sp.]|uniref:DNA polymerase IV n=1 Tax=Segeticoccus sp. TaxID=2706531 RepID=UPI002D7FE7AC|nr:DNA polymerase IV [Segeticoccus sp.]HET8599500.1 DNA polymerase IV [Segeticoccus sp.]